MIKVATVCTGIGAPEQALKELRWDHEIAFGCEIDKFARTTYQANFQAHSLFHDMTAESWMGKEYGHDLLVGGIPCQAFSLAGKRMGELDPRGLLFYNFYDLVDKQRPKSFIIENVKGLLSDNNGKTFQNWIQLLARSVNTQEILFPHPDSLGYNLHYTVLNAKDFGLPQNRERVFIVGIRPDLPNTFRFPVGWSLEIRLKDVLESNVAEKYYLSHKIIGGFHKHNEKSKIKGRGFNFSPTDKNGIAKCIRANNFKMAPDDNYVIDQKLIPFGKSQDQKLSPLNGISQTVSEGHFNQPKVMVEEPCFLNGSTISKTIRSSGGNSMTEKHSFDMIIEPVPVRMVGRNPDNPKSRKTGEYREQTIEAYEEGIFGTITTVQKDNLILVGGLIQGEYYEGGEKEDYSQGARVYDINGVSSTLSAQGGGLGAKTGLYFVGAVQEGELDNSKLSREYPQGSRVYHEEGISQTITAQGAGIGGNSGAYVVQNRIRRLTPRECGRLQGFPDSFIIDQVSETQAYKQFGNSIPVTVLKEILRNLKSVLI